jgi:hypothetical protein
MVAQQKYRTSDFRSKRLRIKIKGAMIRTKVWVCPSKDSRNRGKDWKISVRNFLHFWIHKLQN